ncbi:TetR/AcrR family transcriptional regulator [Maritalea myrionectae]|uniref:TetR/AcrR family transcriptional regulator n=1 Tax=Maritalea myrionectae TaxID=454601 RepID=UPI0004876A2B|nr:helix-turn-helix domain-containing protein [Maritalea myrionectae]
MDKRSQRTRDALLEAMVVLMQEKPWEAITIREICEEADIARSTFYIHFAGKSELQEYGLRFLELELRAMPTSRSLDEDGKLGHLPCILQIMMAPQHQFLFKDAQSSPAASLARSKMSAVAFDLIENEIRSSRYFGQNSELSIHFIAAGVQMAVHQWHQQSVESGLGLMLEELDGIISRTLQDTRLLTS